MRAYTQAGQSAAGSRKRRVSLRYILRGFEVGEHLLEFRQITWCLVGTHSFETFPQVDDRRVLVSAGDGFLGNPFKDFDDGSVRSSHHDGRALSDEALGTKRWEVVTNQLQ